MKKKKKFIMYDNEEIIRVNGKVIGCVYPMLFNDSDQPDITDWGYYHELSDNGGSGVGKKENAIMFLKQDHEEWLSEKEDELNDILRDLKKFMNDPSVRASGIIKSWLRRKKRD